MVELKINKYHKRNTNLTLPDNTNCQQAIELIFKSKCVFFSFFLSFAIADITIEYYNPWLVS